MAVPVDDHDGPDVGASVVVVVTVAGGSRPAVSKGATGRVAAVHHQTRRGLGQAGVFTLAAVVATVAPHDTGVWLPLHLFVLGGLLSAISTTTQMLAVTWSSAAPVPGWAATAQRWCLAVGTIVLCVGRETDSTRLVVVGGAAIVAAVIALVPILLVIRHGAVTDRFTPALDGYVAATTFGVLGALIGVVIAADVASGNWVRLRDVHVTLNVFGLVGVVVVATLPYFAATQARRKMSPRATPATVRAVVATVAVATAVAAWGRWIDLPAMAAAGLGAYAVTLVVVAAILPIYGRRQFRWAGPRLMQLVAGIAWWALSSVALAVAVSAGRSDRSALVTLLVGGFGQILVSSLAYLGPVLRGGGHEQLTAGFAVTRSWTSLVAGNVAAVGAISETGWLLRLGLVVWIADIVVRAVVLGRTRTARVD